MYECQYANVLMYIHMYVCLSFCLIETGKSALCSNYGHYSFTLVKYTCVYVHMYENTYNVHMLF